MRIFKKIILIGHYGVGKTSLIQRFVEETFSDSYKVSIGVYIHKKELVLENNTTVNLIIWDIEGYDSIHKIRESYLLGSHGLIYVFDLTRPKTYQNLTQVQKYVNKKLGNIPIKIVGNKLDMLSKSSLKNKITGFNTKIDYLVSAKNGKKVNSLFKMLAKEMMSL